MSGRGGFGERCEIDAHVDHAGAFVENRRDETIRLCGGAEPRCGNADGESLQFAQPPERVHHAGNRCRVVATGEKVEVETGDELGACGEGGQFSRQAGETGDSDAFPERVVHARAGLLVSVDLRTGERLAAAEFLPGKLRCGDPNDAFKRARHERLDPVIALDAALLAPGVEYFAAACGARDTPDGFADFVRAENGGSVAMSVEKDERLRRFQREIFREEIEGTGMRFLDVNG